MAVAPLKLKHARLPLGLPRVVRPRSTSEFAAIRMRATRQSQRADAGAPEARAPSPSAAAPEQQASGQVRKPRQPQ